MNKKWLTLGEMDAGTKLRTLGMLLAAIVTSYYTYKGLLEDLLNQLGLGKAAVVIALVAVIMLIIAEAIATFYNNDYSEGASIGTVVGRKINLDPTAVVEVIDGDGNDAEDEDEEEDGEADETIEEGE